MTPSRNKGASQRGRAAKIIFKIRPAGGLLRTLARRAGGFTLIELLLVIVVIAILMAILMPALSRARQQAVRQVCNAQIRELEQAVLMYHQDNNRKPEASWLPSVSPAPLKTVRPIFIADALAAFLGDQKRVFRCPNDVANWSDRAPPNAGKSYFETERCSYVWNGLFFVGYEPFHYGNRCWLR